MQGRLWHQDQTIPGHPWLVLATAGSVESRRLCQNLRGLVRIELSPLVPVHRMPLPNENRLSEVRCLGEPYVCDHHYGLSLPTNGESTGITWPRSTPSVPTPRLQFPLISIFRPAWIVGFAILRRN